MSTVGSRKRSYSSLSAIVAFLLIIGGLRLPYLQILLTDRVALGRDFEGLPDTAAPLYPEFLKEVARVTKPGDRIALVVPANRWDAGYSYAYYRASFFLAGREVLPLVWRDDRAMPENLDRATHVASFQTPFNDGRFSVMARGRGGILLARRR